MLKEDSDISLLRLIECFLESAPQLALQLTIILRDSESWKVLQIVSIISSFLGIVWSIAGYHRAIRFAQYDKDNITWCGTGVQFMWHFCITCEFLFLILLKIKPYNFIYLFNMYFSIKIIFMNENIHIYVLSLV